MKNIIAMTRTMTFVLLAVFSVLFVSCEFEEDQMGLPRSVTFHKDGGEKTFKADYAFNSIFIEEGPDTKGFSVVVDGTDIVSYKWLTAKSPQIKNESADTINNGIFWFPTDELTISAEPSKESKSRSLTVTVYSGNKYARIKVKQK